MISFCSVLFCYICLGGGSRIISHRGVRIYITVVKFSCICFSGNMHTYISASQGVLSREGGGRHLSSAALLVFFSTGNIRKKRIYTSAGKGGWKGVEGDIYKRQAGVDLSFVFFRYWGRGLFGHRCIIDGKMEKEERPRNTLASRLDTTISRRPHGWTLLCMWRRGIVCF